MKMIAKKNDKALSKMSLAEAFKKMKVAKADEAGLKEGIKAAILKLPGSNCLSVKGLEELTEKILLVVLVKSMQAQSGSKKNIKKKAGYKAPR